MFLSYRSGYEKDVIHLSERIEEFGVNTFVAIRDLRPCDDWELEIERAITGCDALLAYCPSDFGESEWTTKEVMLAERYRKPVFPIWIGTQPTGPITKRHALILNGDDVPVVEVVKRFTAFPRMTEALVRAIDRCAQHGSFELANRLARCFWSVQHMSTEQADRLIQVYNRKSVINRYGNTNQIRNAVNFRPSHASLSQSVLTKKINRLTTRSVSHDSDGDICDAPPPNNVMSPRASDKPKFTSELSRDPYVNDPHTSEWVRTRSEQMVGSSVNPW